MLRHRARYLVDTTYIFKHFDEYVRQRRSDLQEDKGDVVWNAGYYEKPMDYIRIVSAVENHLKAVLLEQGYMVHYFDSKAPTKHLYAAIAERAGALYEKFVGFTEDLGRIGKNVKDANDSYEKALGKLSEGPGNLVRQVELLKELGAKTNKSLHAKLLERALEQTTDLQP